MEDGPKHILTCAKFRKINFLIKGLIIPLQFSSNSTENYSLFRYKGLLLVREAIRTEIPKTDLCDLNLVQFISIANCYYRLMVIINFYKLHGSAI